MRVVARDAVLLSFLATSLRLPEQTAFWTVPAIDTSASERVSLRLSERVASSFIGLQFTSCIITCSTLAPLPHLCLHSTSSL